MTEPRLKRDASRDTSWLRKMPADGNETRSKWQTGLVIHNQFVGGSPLIRGLDEVLMFPADEYYALYEIVSRPLQITGSSVRAILVDGRIDLVDEYFKGRKWVPRVSFSLYHDGWSGVAHRSSATHRSWESMKSATEGDLSGDLFNFFVNCGAVFDSFAFSVFAAASMLSPARFRLGKPSELRAVSLNSTCERFGAVYPQAPLTLKLRALQKVDQFRVISQLRNVLVHRASPHTYTVEEGRDRWWGVQGHFGGDIPLSSELLDELYGWAMLELQELTASAIDLFRDRFKTRLSADGVTT